MPCNGGRIHQQQNLIFEPSPLIVNYQKLTFPFCLLVQGPAQWLSHNLVKTHTSRDLQSLVYLCLFAQIAVQKNRAQNVGLNHFFLGIIPYDRNKKKNLMKSTNFAFFQISSVWAKGILKSREVKCPHMPTLCKPAGKSTRKNIQMLL